MTAEKAPPGGQAGGSKGPATGSRRSSQQSRNSNTSGLRTKGEAKANEEAPKAS